MGNDAYPAGIERDVTLPGGGQIHLRPIRPDDAARLQALHGRLSRDSIFFRFFSPLPVLSDARAAYFTDVDFQKRLAIVAVDRPADPPAADEEIIGVSRYDLIDDGRAETALIVEDRHQHHGVGTMLFAALIEAAQERGVRVLVANVLPENAQMLHLLQESGYTLRRRRSRDYLIVELDISARAD